MDMLDKIGIHLAGGDGGHGVVSYHREKFVPQGQTYAVASPPHSIDPAWDCRPGMPANFLHPGLAGQAAHGDAWHGSWAFPT